MSSSLKITKKNTPKLKPEANSLALKPTMLLVLGMHRSGTSATARLLECLGAVQSKKTTVAACDNPKGHFEDYDVQNFNEFQLLPRLGIKWHSLAFAKWNTLSESEWSHLELEALDILKTNYSLENPLSILKEPRISILLPFWLPVLNKAGYNVKVVCAIRDPASVSRSLKLRDGFSITHGGMLYFINWLSILSNIQCMQCAFIEFDKIFVDSAKVLGVVSKILGISHPPDFDTALKVFRTEFLDSTLRHSSVDFAEMQQMPDLPALSIDLYKTLLHALRDQDIKITAEFIASAEKIISSLKPIFADFDTLRAKLVERDAKLAERDAQVIRLKRSIHGIKNSLIWRLSTPIRYLHSVLSILKGKIASLR